MKLMDPSDRYNVRLISRWVFDCRMKVVDIGEMES